MDNEYKLDVGLFPYTWDNKYKPYSWCLFKWCGDAWCNYGFGWADTPQKAWKEGYDFYIKFKSED